MKTIIIEDDRSYQKFSEIWKNSPSIIIPIFRDIFKHPSNQNSLSFLFLRTPNENFILPYQHTDCTSFTGKLPPSNQKKYVWDKKSFLQTDLDINNLYDINTYLFFSGNKEPIIDFDKFPLISHYKRNKIENSLGKIIPIYKWIEFLNKATDNINLNSFPKEQSWIDIEMLPILADVERIGLRVNTELYKKTKYSTKHLDGDKVYTRYNPYTITSRPSNTYGGLNFSAIPKKGDMRKMFIPRKGNKFIQFDYDAYHVRIIAKIVEYELPTTSAHEWLAKLYGVSYEESKKITFRILYGGVPDEYKDHPFFKKVDNFIHSFRGETSLTTLKGREIDMSSVNDPSPLKTFNYLLQATETEFNITVMMKLKDKGLPLPVLYTYDSFLFDITNDSGMVNDIQEVVESLGFPTRLSTGMDYSQV